MTPFQILHHVDSSHLWPAKQGNAFSTLPAAYQTALAVRDLRIARGKHGWRSLVVRCHRLRSAFFESLNRKAHQLLGDPKRIAKNARISSRAATVGCPASSIKWAVTTLCGLATTC